jgi:hypothetical protein
MTRVLSFYLVFELLVILVFCWALWLWLGWKPGGPNAFPGSPDAGWLYSNAYSGYHWANGLLEGVWLGGLAFVVAVRRVSPDQRLSRLRNALSVAIAFTPPACLIVGHILESHMP